MIGPAPSITRMGGVVPFRAYRDMSPGGLILLCHLSGLPCIRCVERVAAGTSWQAFNDGVDEATSHRRD